MALALALSGCGTSKSPADLSGPECDTQKQRLLDLLERLPTQSPTTAIAVALPSASLGGAVGQGEVLQVSSEGATFRGKALPGATTSAVADALAADVASSPLARETTVYLAAAYDLDLRTLRRYLLALPAEQPLKLVYTQPNADAAPPPDSVTYEHAARVYTETQPARREKLSEAAFEAYSSCNGLNNAVHSLHGTQLGERWPRLQTLLQQSVPACACGELNAPALEFLVIAEQRAASGTMGSLPVPFLRDARCAASMPLASVQKVLRDVEEFEEEFSGEWSDDALRFEKVVTEERLLNYLCIALPGETLSFLQSEYATTYWKLPGSEQCQAWQFEPLSRGAPLGTWRRVDPSGKLPELALHYRQGAEELRMFGPATETSRPTDGGPWPCDQNVHMKSANADAIALESGQWFLSRAACESAPAQTAQLTGCAATLAAAADPESAALVPTEQQPPTAPPPR